MRLQDLNWMDVERYLENDDRIILVTGATEQHAYLSLMTDALIPQHIADAVAEKEKVLVAPSLNFGVSHFFHQYPGTISLSATTFEHVVLEVFESLCHHGFQRFLIINGHGGNPMPQRFNDFGEGSAVRVIWHDWWKADAAKAFAEKNNLPNAHANWSENFPFTRVADSPTEPKPPVDRAMFSEPFAEREKLGDGNFGGPYQVDDKLMNELFNVAVAEAAGLLRALGRKD
jgi:creatinine amidohydrolase